MDNTVSTEMGDSRSAQSRLKLLGFLTWSTGGLLWKSVCFLTSMCVNLACDILLVPYSIFNTVLVNFIAIFNVKMAIKMDLSIMCWPEITIGLFKLLTTKTPPKGRYITKVIYSEQNVGGGHIKIVFLRAFYVCSTAVTQTILALPVLIPTKLIQDWADKCWCSSTSTDRKYYRELSKQKLDYILSKDIFNIREKLEIAEEEVPSTYLAEQDGETQGTGNTEEEDPSDLIYIDKDVKGYEWIIKCIRQQIHSNQEQIEIHTNVANPEKEAKQRNTLKGNIIHIYVEVLTELFIYPLKCFVTKNMKKFGVIIFNNIPTTVIRKIENSSNVGSGSPIITVTNENGEIGIVVLAEDTTKDSSPRNVQESKHGGTSLQSLHTPKNRELPMEGGAFAAPIPVSVIPGMATLCGAESNSLADSATTLKVAQTSNDIRVPDIRVPHQYSSGRPLQRSGSLSNQSQQVVNSSAPKFLEEKQQLPIQGVYVLTDGSATESVVIKDGRVIASYSSTPSASPILGIWSGSRPRSRSVAVSKCSGSPQFEFLRKSDEAGKPEINSPPKPVREAIRRRGSEGTLEYTSGYSNVPGMGSPRHMPSPLSLGGQVAGSIQSLQEQPMSL